MMEKENNIVKTLEKRFPFLQGSGVVKRARRISIDVPYETFHDVYSFLCKDLEFSILATIVGLDEGESLGVLYGFAQEGGIMITVTTRVPKDNPVIDSIIPVFPGAEMYERELEDLLGMKVRGLPPGHNYPLPDNWPKGQYPLRKDWTGDAYTNAAADEQK